MTITKSYYTSWEDLEAAIRSCSRCSLHRSRRNPVPGEGPRNAEVMFVGEAPGATEDEMGRPFVGAAGKLLTMALESAGIPRSSVYITNVVKCRPPSNREPRPEEIEACSVFLESQILLLKPRIIVTLGNVAGKKVFELGNQRWSGVTKMRGRVYTLSILGLKIVVIPTIHPAAALYNPSMRDILFNDLRNVKRVLDEISRTPAMVSGNELSTSEQGSRKAKSLLDYVKRS